MRKKKIGLGLLFLLVLPSAFGDLLANVYNIYVPIFLQAGGPAFAKSQVLTNGFGLGAFMVGFWMIADNILALFVQPFVGAWSDRFKSRLGKRVPFVLFTLPLIAIGYAIIPLTPNWIPENLNGQFSSLIGPFVMFSITCVLFYLGFLPARIMLQTLRQEAVLDEQRSEVEAWYTFLLNIFTILAFTGGAQIYKLYGPLLFWIILALYIISCIILAVFYKPSEKESDISAVEEKSSLKQIVSILKSERPGEKRNLYFFLASIMFITLALGASANFSSSWVVNVLGVDEARASSILSVATLATIIVILPAGYVAGKKIGRKTVYTFGLSVMTVGGVLLSFFPSLYTISYIIFGIGAGAFYSCMLALLFDMYPEKSVSGALVGVFNIAYFIGFIFGSLIVGIVIEKFGYIALYPSILILGLSSLFSILLTKPEKAALSVEAVTN